MLNSQTIQSVQSDMKKRGQAQAWVSLIKQDGKVMLKTSNSPFEHSTRPIFILSNDPIEIVRQSTKLLNKKRK
jgi:hypothetical protein